MKEEKPQPKIDYVEAFVAGFFLFALPDAIELLLMFVLGDSWFLTDIFFTPASQLYLYLKGIKGTYVLVGNILELIPLAGNLPLRITTFIITVWIEHHPKIKQATEVVSKVNQPSQVKSLNTASSLSGEKSGGNNLSFNLSQNTIDKNTIPKNLNIDYNNIIKNNFGPEIDDENNEVDLKNA